MFKGEVFALVLLYCDGYIQPKGKPKTNKEIREERFLKKSLSIFLFN